MLKTNGTLLLLLTATGHDGHDRNLHGACLLTMTHHDGRRREQQQGAPKTCSAPYSAPPSHLRATAQVSDIACHLASDLGRVNLLLIP